MQLVSDLSGSIQVRPNANGWHNSGTVTIGPGVFGNSTLQPAYLIVYIDNQSIGKDVWFDDLHIEHYKSTVLEEEHYYPFGLTLNLFGGTGSGLVKNDIKFQGQRHDNDLGINIYSFKYREHDPQIGRFWQIDPLSYSVSSKRITGNSSSFCQRPDFFLM